MAKILVISPTPTHPQDAGNRARIFSLLSGLKAGGYQVHFAFVKTEVGDEVAMAGAWDGFFPISYRRPTDRWLKKICDECAKQLGISWVFPYRIDDWYTTEISRQLSEIRQQVQPNVVLVEYVFLSGAFQCFGPETLKVLDTHDIFGNRHRLYQQNGMVPQWFYTTVAEEKKALDRADAILAIQDEEAAYFLQLTERPVLTVGHLVHTPTPVAEEEVLANRLLFVGSANPINVDALHWFLKEVFPLVRRRLPNIELEVVGECAKMIPTEDGLIPRGRVADLAPYYRNAMVVINPMRFGTGLKIKTTEALAHGRPLVTTSVGAAGFEEWKNKGFLVADTPEDFAGAIERLCDDAELRAALQEQCRDLIASYNRTVLTPLTEMLKTCQLKYPD